MKKRKYFRGVFAATLLALGTAAFLYMSAGYYKVGMVDRAILDFGVAMILGMQTTAVVISLRLGKIEKLMETLIERLEDKEN